MNRTNIYDVESYTDEELYEILDLNSPTDRELEAKILFFIRKYESIQNPESEKIAEFFKNIYSHFFETEEEEDDEDNDNINNKKTIENFDASIPKSITATPTTTTSPSTFIISGDGNVVSGNTIPSSNDIGNTTASTSNYVQLTSTLDYAKGNLNPILKIKSKYIY